MTNNTQTPTQETPSEQEIKAAVEAMFRNVKGVSQPVPVKAKKAPAQKEGK